MIRSEFEISDMVVMDLDWYKGSLTVIKEGDHLLRRFGAVNVVRIEPEGSIQVYRQQADEIWAVLSGYVSLHLQDQRQDSPSQGTEVDLGISQDTPQAVLIPLGVLCKGSSTRGATLLRITTHQDGSQHGDQIP